MAGVFGGAKTSSNFQINLDSPFVVFYGDQHEAEPATLTGSVVLNNPDHMNVRNIRIKLEGKWRVSWAVNNGPSSPPSQSSQMIRDRGIVVSDEQTFIPAPGEPVTTHRIAPGRHEWRFSFSLDPSLPESVEGLSGNFVVYNLTAELDRGYLSKGFLARKHVRVVRTLSRDMAETVPFPYTNEDTWAGKIRYQIYIPSRYYIFGTTIPVDFTIFPLRKGVRIGKVRMDLLERVALETGKGSDQNAHATTLEDRVVGHVEQSRPPETQPMIEPSSGMADDSYHFRINLPLKKSLNDCRQTVHTDHIKIHHNLKIYVNIHNPDGHVSQLCLRNLMHIYISPHMPINEDQTVSENTSSLVHLNPNSATMEQDAPPTYGSHVLDQLYSDIDQSGFISGVATPYHFLSRRQSVENLAGNLLSGFQSSAGSSARSSSSIPDTAALQLQSRLAALQDRRPSINSVTQSLDGASPENRGGSPPEQDSQFAQRPHFFASFTPPLDSHAVSDSPPLEHPPSTGGLSTNVLLAHRRHLPVPPAIGLGLDRVPSYNTAVRTSTPPLPPSAPPAMGLPAGMATSPAASDDDGLPSYDFACGLTAPNSPSPAPASLAVAVQMLTPVSGGGHSRAPSSMPPTPPAEDSPAVHAPGTSWLSLPPSYGAAAAAPAPVSPLPRVVGSALLAPQLAHVRGRSVGAVSDAVLRALRISESGQRPQLPPQQHQPLQQQQNGQQQPQRPSIAIGGGSLQGLWGGGRRGSH